MSASFKRWLRGLDRDYRAKRAEYAEAEAAEWICISHYGTLTEALNHVDRMKQVAAFLESLEGGRR